MVSTPYTDYAVYPFAFSPFDRDEKATMLSQIRTLQSQQEALGDRIESLSQTADSAMEREREAEERLDQALSVHAHQISQRQVRRIHYLIVLFVILFLS